MSNVIDDVSALLSDVFGQEVMFVSLSSSVADNGIFETMLAVESFETIDNYSNAHGAVRHRYRGKAWCNRGNYLTEIVLVHGSKLFSDIMYIVLKHNTKSL